MTRDALESLRDAYVLAGAIEVGFAQAAGLAEDVEELVGELREALAAGQDPLPLLDGLLETARQAVGEDAEELPKYRALVDRAEILLVGADIESDVPKGIRQPLDVLRDMFPPERPLDSGVVTALQPDGLAEPVALRIGERLYVPVKDCPSEPTGR